MKIRQRYTILPSVPASKKTLATVVRNFGEADIKDYLLCSVLVDLVSLLQIFCQKKLHQKFDSKLQV